MRRRRGGRPPFLLGGVPAGLDGGREALAEQGPPVVQGDLLTGSQDGAGRGRLGPWAQLAKKGDGLFDRQPSCLAVVRDSQRRHRSPSQKNLACFGGTPTNSGLQN